MFICAEFSNWTNNNSYYIVNIVIRLRKKDKHIRFAKHKKQTSKLVCSSRYTEIQCMKPQRFIQIIATHIKLIIFT